MYFIVCEWLCWIFFHKISTTPAWPSSLLQHELCFPLRRFWENKLKNWDFWQLITDILLPLEQQNSWVKRVLQTLIRQIFGLGEVSRTKYILFDCSAYFNSSTSARESGSQITVKRVATTNTCNLLTHFRNFLKGSIPFRQCAKAKTSMSQTYRNWVGYL